MDFICLPQYYRTPEQEVFFQRAMANMHVLYAHCNVIAVRLENLANETAKSSPPDFIDIYYEEASAQRGSGKFGPQPFSKLQLNDTPYHERGWCAAEKQWMLTQDNIVGLAPMAPARFQERVKRGHRNLPDGLVLKFTHRSDEEIVVKLQEKIFLQQAQARERLRAMELPESELMILAESLPHFVNLQRLTFDHLEIGPAAASALINGLKPLKRLTFLMFADHCNMEEKAATILARGFLEWQFAQDLPVHFGIGSKKLEDELRLLKSRGRMERVVRNAYQDFTIQAGGWRCWPVRCLWRQLAKICC